MILLKTWIYLLIGSIFVLIFIGDSISEMISLIGIAIAIIIAIIDFVIALIHRKGRVENQWLHERIRADELAQKEVEFRKKIEEKKTAIKEILDEYPILSQYIGSRREYGDLSDPQDQLGYDLDTISRLAAGLETARAKERISEYEVAASIYDDVGIKEESKRLWSDIANRYELAARYDDAARIYREKINDTKQEHRVKALFAKELEDAGQLDEAADIYQSAEMYNDEKRIKKIIAQRLEDSGKELAAIEIYEKISMPEEVRRVKLNVESDLETTGKFEEAAKIYEQLGMWQEAGQVRRKILFSKSEKTEPSDYDAFGKRTVNVRFNKDKQESGREKSHPAGNSRMDGKVEYSNVSDGAAFGGRAPDGNARLSDFFEIDMKAKIGRGGNATVYRAVRKNDGQVAAIKVPRDIEEGETLSDKLLISFQTEANTWSKLDHPNIVRVYQYGLRPYPWIAIELMEGDSLRKRLPIQNLDESWKIIDQVLDGLYYAHHRGVIHRDLKPENILLTKDLTPKISDWGIAKTLLLGPRSSTTKYTMYYSAPEQMAPKKFGPTDWTTDIFQMGIVTYEIMTDKYPFEGEGIAEVQHNILEETPLPPSQLKKKIPEGVDKVIMKALEKRPENRFESIKEFRTELKEALIHPEGRPREVDDREKTLAELKELREKRNKAVGGESDSLSDVTNRLEELKQRNKPK